MSPPAITFRIGASLGDFVIVCKKEKEVCLSRPSSKPSWPPPAEPHLEKERLLRDKRGRIGKRRG
jgi:hypothetical protein